MNEFTAQLRAWVEQRWATINVTPLLESQSAEFPLVAPQWLPLTGDAGFRRYFRIPSSPALLAVYAPPATENMTAFIEIAQHLSASGVLAPSVLAFDKSQGFMLIEDLGSSLLFNELSDASVDGLYSAAMQSLSLIQQSPINEAIFPRYSKQKLLEEMQLFKDWFVPKLLGYCASSDQSRMLDDWFLTLTGSALEQPAVVVHRDFHSRNLIFRSAGLPGVIDFQDAVVGPITYDLVSLLRDCYVQWPDERVTQWASSYYQSSVKQGLLTGVTEQRFLQWFDLMGLQRHIKVLGIFARLSLRDGKHGYLNDLPLVIEYTLQVAKRYPQASAFVAFFEQVLMPIIRQQSWYTKDSAASQ